MLGCLGSEGVYLFCWFDFFILTCFYFNFMSVCLRCVGKDGLDWVCVWSFLSMCGSFDLLLIFIFIWFLCRFIVDFSWVSWQCGEMWIF